MEEHSREPAKKALGDALRERGWVDDVGNADFATFYRACNEQNPGWSVKHLARMINGGRTLQPKAIELMAELLEIEPNYFREYRLFQLGEDFKEFPELEEQYYRQIKADAMRLRMEKQEAKTAHPMKNPLAKKPSRKSRRQAEQ